MHEDQDYLGKIFIAGTGRSGKVLLHRIIGRHPDVFPVPGESKFIVEGDGLNALLPWLFDGFSITASELALTRFIAMVGGKLPGKMLSAAAMELYLG